jgi:hypothetical protein
VTLMHISANELARGVSCPADRATRIVLRRLTASPRLHSEPEPIVRNSTGNHNHSHAGAGSSDRRSCNWRSS